MILNPKHNVTIKSLLYNKYLILLFAPTLIYFFIFKYLPMYGIIIAFKEYRIIDGIVGSPWVGLTNFTRLLSGSGFINVLSNTLIISFYKMLIGFPAPIILALLLNEVTNRKFKRINQTISYLPHFLSWVVLAGIVYEILSIRGPVNYFVTLLGGKESLIMGDTSLFRGILIVSDIWKEVGWGAVIYLATISGINPNLYEAATIDGAGRFRKVWNITVPCMLPMIMVLLILRVGRVLDAGFDQIFNMYNSLVYSVADIIDTYVYRAGFVEMDYSYSTAAGLFKNVIGFILILTTNRISKTFGDYGIW